VKDCWVDTHLIPRNDTEYRTSRFRFSDAFISAVKMLTTADTESAALSKTSADSVGTGRHL
jgi:hypothetical protein